ncbi:PREDICTED: uncharacterized protein LOC109479363 [Branchiostoma belcheri]|uniref:Uncharacterized protein LOC109479363 n=1 Tax=Branchiostoma belcheri TaxID=7741 RepID=A0A6P5A524_BRABE|nr:PREDICTED: uncharacterized protein LOC109479363 [Branchiostoma belcheri]
MGKWDGCCVPGCGSTRTNSPNLSFYRLPEKPTRKQLWLRAIGKVCTSKLWKPSKTAKICSMHFINGTKSDTPGTSGYVPTIFEQIELEGDCKSRQKNDRTTVLKATTTTATVSQPETVSQPTVNPSVDDEIRSEMSRDDEDVPRSNGHDYLKTMEDTSTTVDFEEYVRLRVEMEEMKAEVEKLKKACLRLDNIKDNNDKFRFWTGFPNYGTFQALFEYLKPKAAGMKYWRGGATLDSEHYSYRYSMKPGQRRTLTLEEEFFAVMVRLRVGLLVKDIAARFLISESTFSRLFTSWINLMYQELKGMFELPSRKVAQEGKARCFNLFPEVYITVDCTELFTEKPSDLDTRKQLYSNYKHHETVKFLIGVSPSMAVIYCSPCYGGRASDKYITGASEDLLQSLKPGDSVMADKGFTVECELAELGVKLLVPDFKGVGRSQLTSAEVERSNGISKARVHVERIIGRIKRFHILDGQLKLSMSNSLEQIFVVCAYLVNFQTPVVRNDGVNGTQ